MLSCVFKRTPILTPRHRPTWWLITSGPNKLTPIEFNGVVGGINQLIIGTHNQVTVPCFKAGANWNGLPWNILWAKAARQNEQLAGCMFGLMAQYAFIHHPAQWWTGSTTYAGHNFPNAYYFR